MKILQHLPPLVFLLIATTLEVSGDALVRKGIYNFGGTARLGLFLAGAVLLFGYGFTLNLAPVEFGQVVGLYIATLFVVWQVINWVAFHKLPTLPIIVGGALVIAGGLIITFWKYA
jgi:drug/metabolite transporter (DMT)-like permease